MFKVGEAVKAVMEFPFVGDSYVGRGWHGEVESDSVIDNERVIKVEFFGSKNGFKRGIVHTFYFSIGDNIERWLTRCE